MRSNFPLLIRESDSITLQINFSSQVAEGKGAYIHLPLHIGCVLCCCVTQIPPKIHFAIRSPEMHCRSSSLEYALVSKDNSLFLDSLSRSAQPPMQVRKEGYLHSQQCQKSNSLFINVSDGAVTGYQPRDQYVDIVLIWHYNKICHARCSL